MITPAWRVGRGGEDEGFSIAGDGMLGLEEVGLTLGTETDPVDFGL